MNNQNEQSDGPTDQESEAYVSSGNLTGLYMRDKETKCLEKRWGGNV